MPRKFPGDIKCVVIKVGSSLITNARLHPNYKRLNSLVDQICDLRRKNINVVLVSSGAIVLGLGQLQKNSRAVGLDFLQAAAAIGQIILMQIYSRLFTSRKSKCAQILLTWDDFDNRQKYTNARNTLKTLFQNAIVPIINENDTVSTDEIRQGDNDKLSTLVASLVHADLLILLSDVDGLYVIDKGQKKYLKEVDAITSEIESIAKGTSKKLFSRGGMSSKIEAIHIATHAKIPCIIANGRMKNIIARVMNKERIGTFFVEKNKKMADRKHWISFSGKEKGRVYIDDGAKAAILKGGRSLLLVGVEKISGDFKKGDIIVVYDSVGFEVARGISNHPTVTLVVHKDENPKGVKVIHVDNLVLGKR